MLTIGYPYRLFDHLVHFLCIGLHVIRSSHPIGHRSDLASAI